METTFIDKSRGLPARGWKASPKQVCGVSFAEADDPDLKSFGMVGHLEHVGLCSAKDDSFQTVGT
jgi:hypothetical protein